MPNPWYNELLELLGLPFEADFTALNTNVMSSLFPLQVRFSRKNLRNLRNGEIQMRLQVGGKGLEPLTSWV